MKTNQVRAKSPIDVTSVAILVAGALLVPLIVLLPFAIHSHSSYLSVGSQVLAWHSGRPIESKPQVGLGWNPPPDIGIIGALSLIVIAILSAFTLWRGYAQKGLRSLQRFVLYNLVIALGVVLVTTTSYAVMRIHSQSEEKELSSTTATYVVHTQPADCSIVVSLNGSGQSSFTISNPPTCTHRVVSPAPKIGYGIKPVYLVLISGVYVLAPLLNWYRFYLSPTHIGGQRKEKLFQ